VWVRPYTGELDRLNTPAHYPLIKPLPDLTQKEEQAVTPAPTPAETPPTSLYTSDNEAMNYIFSRESGGNPYAENPEGCLGLGQACPGSKLLDVCPTLNPDCQVSFFTVYMNNVYGSWENAAQHEAVDGWW